MFTLATLASVIDTSQLPKPNTSDGSLISTALFLVFSITAAVSALMIVIGGFRYIVAHGDANAVGQAKKTILYAIIGLIVTVAAYSIVTLVIRGVA